MRMGGMVRRLLTAALLLGATAACSDDPADPADTATFTVEVSGEQFKVKVQGEPAIVAMQGRLMTGQTGVISGKLVRGDGGFNNSWGWHMDPTTVTAPDLAIELCDGRPSMVQSDLNYWVDTVKQYCPWGAKVVAQN